jgi:hypothetical protein
VTAHDRSSPPVMARMWHSGWACGRRDRTLDRLLTIQGIQVAEDRGRSSAPRLWSARARCRSAWLLHFVAGRVGARGLFVPKPSCRTDCQGFGMPGLGNTVRRRPPPSVVVGGDCYSLGYSVAREPMSQAVAWEFVWGQSASRLRNQADLSVSDRSSLSPVPRSRTQWAQP